MIHQTFTVDSAPDLVVRFESGRLEIRQGPTDTVEVRVDTKSPGFTVEQRGNSILVSSDKDASWLSRGSASVVIETPPGSNASVAVASASVNIDVAMNKVEVKTASGDVDLGTVESLKVSTASGDLDVISVERDIRFTSASGDLRVAERVTGSLEVSTASGDVHVEHADATLELKSASGDAYITRFEGRSANFKTMSGDVDLGIPTATSVDLDVTLLSGKLRLPDPATRQGPAERRMSIRAKMVSGDFTITRI